MLVLALTAHAGTTGDIPEADPATALVEQPLDVLANPQTDRARRVSAASALLVTDQHLDVLAQALRTDDPAGSRIAVAEAVAGSSVPPAAFAAVLVEILPDAPIDDQVALLGALERYPTRPAVRATAGTLTAAARMTGPDGERITLAAIRTLARQTARTDLPPDPDAWQAWWRELAQLTPIAFAQGQAWRHARAADRLANDQQTLVIQLADAYRRLHARTPEAERSPLLAELIRARETILAQLGFDLATQALLNALQLDDRVANAAAERLAEDDGPLRGQAALLIEKLDRPEQADLVLDVLEDSVSPEVAATLLRFTARHPAPRASRIILRWAGADPPADNAAIEAALAQRREGWLRADDEVARLRLLLLGRGRDRLTPAAVRLSASIGEYERVATLLDAEDRALARAAAASFATWPEDHVDALLAAAAESDDLFQPTVAALIAHRRDAAGFRVARRLPAPTPEVHRQELLRFAVALDPESLLAAMSPEAEPGVVETYIAHVASPEYINAQTEMDAVLDLLALLGKTRLRLGNPSGALAAVDALPTIVDLRLDAVRVTALGWLNRVDEAVEISDRSDVPPTPWLDALEAAISLPHAQQLRDVIQVRYVGSLSDAEAIRLGALDLKLGNVGPVPEEEGAADDDAGVDGEAPPPSG